MIFRNRSEAGRLLAERVAELELFDPIVYALPRGGVPVAVEVARTLAAPLDLLIVRKIGAPGFPEVALGAVVGGVTPQLVLNDDIYAATGRDAANLERARRSELDEVARRRRRYLGDRPVQDPAGRVTIVVDDGIATGATARVALAALRAQGAATIVLAVPVAPASSVEDLKSEADIVVVLHAPEEFWAIGQFYRDFHQLSDEETISYLRAAWDSE
ncbi:phosphoribosyltransferase [Cryobacterium psychrophilum]|uniref:Phosphoribosyltransferase n=1 Tax=Cryobacterium psychrophilum TaxID=41988 RepID=A0A4Y8KI90_9MICO|nr:phosphoribosyltransferase family protein [Cryobacterium psychrophilum]TDW28438.1 putative phosphoribosyltransferase [Cryobacterium psychrophilum]TFD75116.1 phosphoribosyltransferase [Cryobacterium psychrophilum]